MSRLLDTFLDLARISSPTGREAKVAEYAAASLAAIGCDVRFDATRERTGADVGNLIALLPGTTAGIPLAFSAHMDCVQPCEGVEPVIEDGVVRSAGETVLGADDKAGIAAIIEALQRLSDSGEPHGDIRVVLTVSEEQGLLGAKALSPVDCSAELCLVLDADGPVGGIVIAAPTHYTFTAQFSGRAAHAGVEPERGVSAIRIAADAIGAMDLGRLDERTTANIGTIAGGSATNVVAPSATVTGECRSTDRARVEAVRDTMDAAMRQAASASGGSVDVTWRLEYEGFAFAEDAPALALVEAACRDIGVTPRRFATGGGSDGNIFSGHGTPTLVLSSGMSKVHGVEEEIAVGELERLTELLIAVVRRATG